MGVTLGVRLGNVLGVALGVDLCASSSGTAPGSIVSAANQLAWFRADQGITLNGARVSGWANIWGNGNFAQATGASQPLFEAAGLGGHSAVTNDGTTGMLGTLTSGVAVGERPYVWCMCQLDTLEAASRFFCGVGNTTIATAVYVGPSSSGKWRFVLRGNSAQVLADSTLTPVAGVSVLVEAGLTSNAVNALVVSGTGVKPASVPGHAGSATTSIALFGVNGAVASPALGKVAEIVLVRNEPTPQQKQDMRSYFRTRYGTI